MKNIAVLLIITLFAGSVSATNLYQNSNPFPQTEPQTMNNIYESKPATIQQEEKQAKKSWFRKGKNIREQEAAEAKRSNLQTYPANESENNGSFYIFK